ncbi:citrinin biosynthesis transcriptional activator CtnR [Metarhizium guizhouense ARSEF 977]|uniref:Citrinin biosynthesis transcriptional activator CtnR n=1 Tax=Metarhizium guizhouense (strain ARSEF 977) TaxID=1276136 RepID=A0A0B4G5S1_METGA|nr:citrinin biosynthesis transcriptional activator CtnR [Metarhizium guizhouense ARSEF 977]
MGNSAPAENDSQTSASGKKRSRQNPGPACQQCRLRKLRCNRQTPCNGCADAGLPCHVDTSPPQRGPKKGHLKVLRSRIAAIENHIGIQATDGSAWGDGAGARVTANADSEDDEDDSHESDEPPKLYGGSQDPFSDGGVSSFMGNITPTEMMCPTDEGLGDLDALGLQMFLPLLGCPGSAVASPPVGTMLTRAMSNPLGASNSDTMSSLMRADLDQLYFDRVHVFMPMIQPHRFFQRSRDSSAGPFHKCLQRAMWAVAGAMSSSFRHLCDGLYRETLERLHSLEKSSAGITSQGGKEGETALLDQAQTWILVATFELMCLGECSFQQAWTSAGRAIRLVQLMHLGDKDADGSLEVLGDGDEHNDVLVEREERRRTFWMTFCLDRLACAIEGLPMTLTDKASSLTTTRLPCPEDAFLNGTPIVMPLLSHLLASESTMPAPPVSPLVECIVFIALWGRVLGHYQSAAQQRICGGIGPDFSDRHLRLDNLISRRIWLFQQTYRPSSVQADATLLFASMIMQAVVLSLAKGTDTLPTGVVSSHRQKAHDAGRDINRFADMLKTYIRLLKYLSRYAVTL